VQRLRIDVDLVALQGKFFRRLQHQLDVIKLLEAGAKSVTEAQVAEQVEFGRFVPASGAQLPHEQARTEAFNWLLKSFLRDAIEGTGLFLDGCLGSCALMLASSRGKLREDVDRLLNVLPRVNHRLHLPQKLEKLQREFGVATRFDRHVLSLNRARTCIVHRLGMVTALDANAEGVLTVIFQRADLVAVGQHTGAELRLEPGITVPEESILEMRFVDSERRFAVGSTIQLDAREIYDTIITLWRFGMAAALAVEAYGKSLGLQFAGHIAEGTDEA
jgi:hypothetical protein